MRSQASWRLRPPVPRKPEKIANWSVVLDDGWWAISCGCGVYYRAIAEAVDWLSCRCGRHYDRPA